MMTTLRAIRPVYTTRSFGAVEEHPLTPKTLERMESLFEPRPAPSGDAGHLVPQANGPAKPARNAPQRHAFSVQAPPPVAPSAEK